MLWKFSLSRKNFPKFKNSLKFIIQYWLISFFDNCLAEIIWWLWMAWILYSHSFSANTNNNSNLIVPVETQANPDWEAGTKTVMETRECNTLIDSNYSSVHGQAQILEWVAISFSRAFSWPRDWILVSYTAVRFFTIWEAPNHHHKEDKNRWRFSEFWHMKLV